MKKSLKIYSEEIIDRESELHYARHKSLRDITTEHTHNFYELFLITSGSLVHQVNGIRQVLYSGSLVFMRPSDIHFYSKHKNSESELINIAFPRSTLDDLLNFMGEGFDTEPLLFGKFPPSIHLPEIEKELLVSKMEKLNLVNREFKKEIRTQLRILLVEIFSRYFININNNSDNSVPSWLDVLREEMLKKENFIAGFKQMQNLANRSKEHICREFKKHFNLTPTEFINDLRLNFASNLLTNSDEGIPYISMEAGFENLSHFYHLFKKKYGVSPAKFRTENQKVVIP
ncbi:MAG: helix-turn-helix domain-containing protein [Melioribacteraceae bacterium]|nr:helix-turn-helix domain-containing protein [Melioribacteraceae bacterium]